MSPPLFLGSTEAVERISEMDDDSAADGPIAVKVAIEATPTAAAAATSTDNILSFPLPGIVASADDTVNDKDTTPLLGGTNADSSSALVSSLASAVAAAAASNQQPKKYRKIFSNAKTDDMSIMHMSVLHEKPLRLVEFVSDDDAASQRTQYKCRACSQVYMAPSLVAASISPAASPAHGAIAADPSDVPPLGEHQADFEAQMKASDAIKLGESPVAQSTPTVPRDSRSHLFCFQPITGGHSGSSDSSSWDMCPSCVCLENDRNRTEMLVVDRPPRKTDITTAVLEPSSTIRLFRLAALLANETASCDTCHSAAKCDRVMFLRVVQDSTTAEAKSDPHRMRCLPCVALALKRVKMRPLQHSDCMWEGHRPYYRSNLHAHPLAMYDSGPCDAQFICSACNERSAAPPTANTRVAHDGSALIAPRLFCPFSCKFNLCIKCSAREIEDAGLAMRIRIAKHQPVAGSRLHSFKLSAHVSDRSWVCWQCVKDVTGPGFRCTACAALYLQECERATFVGRHAPNRFGMCKDVCIHCAMRLLQIHPKAELLKPLPHMVAADSAWNDALGPGGANLSLVPVTNVSSGAASRHQLTLTVLDGRGFTPDKYWEDESTQCKPKFKTLTALRSTKVGALLPLVLQEFGAVSRATRLDAQKALECLTDEASAEPAESSNEQTDSSSTNTNNNGDAPNDANKFIAPLYHAYNKDMFDPFDSIVDVGGDLDGVNKYTKRSVRAVKKSIAEERKLGSDSRNFRPRLWCEGNFLPNHATLQQCSITSKSVIYLMFECTLRRPKRSDVYRIGRNRMSFCVFVRHTHSRTLVRINVKDTTCVRNIKHLVFRQTRNPSEDGDMDRDGDPDDGTNSDSDDDEATAFSDDDDGADDESGTEDGESDTEGGDGGKANMRRTRDTTHGAASVNPVLLEAQQRKLASRRTVLLHHGRVLFDHDTLDASCVKPGDVLTLIDKVSVNDRYLHRTYSQANWYGSMTCREPVPYNSMYDLQAMWVQLQHEIDSIVFDERWKPQLQSAFNNMDTQRNESLDGREMSVGIHALLHLLKNRLTQNYGGSSERWLESLSDAVTGSWDQPSTTFAFIEPVVFPMSSSVSFDQFRRIFSDVLLECIRLKTMNMYFPEQVLVKPVLPKPVQPVKLRGRSHAASGGSAGSGATGGSAGSAAAGSAAIGGGARSSGSASHKAGSVITVVGVPSAAAAATASADGSGHPLISVALTTAAPAADEPSAQRSSGSLFIKSDLHVSVGDSTIATSSAPAPSSSSSTGVPALKPRSLEPLAAATQPIDKRAVAQAKKAAKAAEMKLATRQIIRELQPRRNPDNQTQQHHSMVLRDVYNNVRDEFIPALVEMLVWDLKIYQLAQTPARERSLAYGSAAMAALDPDADASTKSSSSAAAAELEADESFSCTSRTMNWFRGIGRSMKPYAMHFTKPFRMLLHVLFDESTIWRSALQERHWLWPIVFLITITGVAVYAFMFYLPWFLMILYHSLCANKTECEFSLLEVWTPLVLTTILSVLMVADEVRSTSKSSLTVTAEMVEQAFVTANLLVLEMAAQPICLRDDGLSIAAIQAATNSHADNSLYVHDYGSPMIDFELDVTSKAPAFKTDSTALIIHGDQSRSAFNDNDLIDKRSGADGGSNAETGKDDDDSGATKKAVAMHESVDAGHTVAYGVDLDPPKCEHEAGLEPSALSNARLSRQYMSSRLLKQFRFSNDTSSSDWSRYLLIFVLACAIMVVPGAYREQKDGRRYFGSEWYENLMAFGTLIALPAFWRFLNYLARACIEYNQLGTRLENIGIVANATLAQARRCPYYLDIRNPRNLAYWLALREEAKRVDTRLLSVMAVAMLFDIGLLVASVLRVLVLQRGTTDLFNVISLVDMLELSFFVVTFLVIVVRANSTIGIEHPQLVQRMRQSVSLEICGGDTWGAVSVDVSDARGVVDTWSEIAEFSTPEYLREREKEVREELEMQASTQLEAGALQSSRSLMRAPSFGVVGGKSPRGLAVGASARASRRPSLMQGGGVQAMGSFHGKSANEAVAATAATGLLVEDWIGKFDDLTEGIQELSAVDSTALKVYRHDLQTKLLDSTLMHLQTMDEPVKILGLVIKQSLVLQVGTLAATGALSAAWNYIKQGASM